MKSLRPWEKSFLRFLPKKFRPAHISCLALLSVGMAGMLLVNFFEALFVSFDWFREGAIALKCLQKRNPDWLINFLVSNKLIGLCALSLALILSMAGYFWIMRLLFLDQVLPENVLPETQKIISENPEFSEILELAIQEMAVQDDGDKLSTINHKIRRLVWDRERLIYKQKETENLKEKIKKTEIELKIN